MQFAAAEEVLFAAAKIIRKNFIFPLDTPLIL